MTSALDECLLSEDELSDEERQDFTGIGLENGDDPIESDSDNESSKAEEEESGPEGIEMHMNFEDTPEILVVVVFCPILPSDLI
ncbi:unnamed protein product [Enterobius vermicularis]|uniref:Acidic leucine-rich nuclear phosphoprotein 32-related protein 2-like n=1 Tax=Enterobius vermicularis TaxID=51028 RepID=A0A0N4UUM6_ENTVE|nr:unnamed protein product [Enterobius vermicularis]